MMGLSGSYITFDLFICGEQDDFINLIAKVKGLHPLVSVGFTISVVREPCWIARVSAAQETDTELKNIKI